MDQQTLKLLCLPIGYLVLASRATRKLSLLIEMQVPSTKYPIGKHHNFKVCWSIGQSVNRVV